MCELFIELLTARLQHDPVPCNLLHTLGREGGVCVCKVIYNYFEGKLREFYFTQTNFRFPKKLVLSFFEMKMREFFYENFAGGILLNCPKGRKVT